jgi:hypothetical protein
VGLFGIKPHFIPMRYLQDFFKIMIALDARSKVASTKNEV